MNFDLLVSVQLTACAATVVAALALALGENTRVRIQIAALLGAWFAVVATLAATSLLQGRLGTPGLGLVVLLPILLTSFAVMRLPVWHRRLLAMPLVWLVAVNVVRVFGAVFLILHGDGRLPATFATVAGWGDIIVGLAAAPVAWMVATKGHRARSVVLAWNAVGLLDLIAAVGLGAMSAPGPLQVITEQPDSSLMTTLPWLLIPGFMVPLLALTHLAVFHRLRGFGAPRIEGAEAFVSGR